MSAPELTKVEMLEAKLAANREARGKAEETQYEADLEARIELETEHGTIAAVKISGFKAGHPTRAYLRTPTSSEYKRYKAQNFATANGKKSPVTPQQSQEQLASSCWVYPADKADQDAMLEAFPGLLTPISMAALALAEGKTEETGKD